MTTASTPYYLRLLSEYICDAGFDTLPRDVLARARWLIADTLPLVALGMQATVAPFDDRFSARRQTQCRADVDEGAHACARSIHPARDLIEEVMAKVRRAGSIRKTSSASTS